MEEKEIELIDLLNVIWKRKWLIIIPTFFFIIASGIISFLLTPTWEVDAIIQPGRFFVQTEAGQFEEIVVVDPEQIASQINQDSYNSLIASELNLDVRKFPKLRAENLRNTKLVRISLREQDVGKAKLILNSLLKYLSQELEKADIETPEVDIQIKSNELEKIRIGKEIKIVENKLSIIKQRKIEIEKGMSDVRQRIESLEEEQRLILKNKNRSEIKSLGMLLYSNEVQQSLQYYNTLNELLSRKKIEEEDLKLVIDEKEERKEELESIIDKLEKRKGKKEFSQIMKEPTPSVSPVAPRKKLNVLIAGMLSLMIFTMLSFFLEYIKKQKSKG